MVSGLGNSSVSDNDGPNRAREVTCAILKALNLVDQMLGSVRDFEDVLAFAKELYCKPPDCNLEEYWPKNWRDTRKLLKDCGYKDPKELLFVWMIVTMHNGTSWTVPMQLADIVEKWVK